MNELSPCKENVDMSNKNSISDRSKRQQTSSTATPASGSSFGTSALDRLRYNLSPVTSYYKPLMKSITRRDESPSKVSKSYLRTQKSKSDFSYVIECDGTDTNIHIHANESAMPVNHI